MLNSFGFCSSEKVLISPLFLKDIFSGYKILGWYFIFFSWRFPSTVFSLVLISHEKSDVFLIFVPLYMLCHFLLVDLKIFSLSLVWSILVQQLICFYLTNTMNHVTSCASFFSLVIKNADPCFCPNSWMVCALLTWAFIIILLIVSFLNIFHPVAAYIF